MMKRRYTAFFVSFFLVLFSAVSTAQNTGGANAATAQAKTFTAIFGTDGGLGFDLTFYAPGAQLVSMRMLGQYTNVDHEVDPSHYLISDSELLDPSKEGGQFYGWFGLSEVGTSLRVTPDGKPVNALKSSLAIDKAVWSYETSDNQVVFSLDLGRGLSLEKTFSYQAGRRDLMVEFALRASGTHPRAGEELEFQFFSAGVRSPKSEYVLGANPARALGLQLAGDEEKWTFLEVGSVGKEEEAMDKRLASGRDGWQIQYAGTTSRFFGAFLFPVDEHSRGAWLSADADVAPNKAQSGMDRHGMPIVKNRVRMKVPAGEGVESIGFRLYIGPKSKRLFAEFPEYQMFEEVVNADLEPPCCPLPGAKYVARFLLWLLGVIQSGVVNWGIAIMILTLIVRGSLAPLNFRMQKTMREYGAKMKVVKPKLDALQAKYKNDKKKLQMEMAKFQKEHKIFPPVGGCLPIFITMPIFIGLFTALRSSYDLRHKPFFGWITDLSTPDQLFHLGWGFGMEYFNILPLIMVFMWWWLQKGTPLPSDPQQAQMMKMMRFMPLMFGVMLYNYASGLMVYMITSSAWGIVEQKISRKLLGPIDPDAGGMGTMPMM